MRVLISDYSSDITTESLYMNTCLNEAGCKSTVLSNKTSIYDGFDMCKPDVYITYHENLSKDLVEYLKDTTAKKTDIVINISGLTQEHLSKLDSIFSDNNIKPALYFTNYYDHGLTSRNNIVAILPGADLFLTSEKQAYEIDYGIFVNSKEDLIATGSTYHFITLNKGIDKIADIYLPIHRLTHLYSNYKNIVFKYCEALFSQVFFDAAIKTDSVFFNTQKPACKEFIAKYLPKLLGDSNYCSLESPDSGHIKKIILGKHTCFHRAKSLLSQLPAKEYVDNTQKLIDKLPRG